MKNLSNNQQALSKILRRLRMTNSAGQSLIEVLVATTIITIVMTAIAAALTFTIKSNSQSRYLSHANFFGQELLEFFKRERVKNTWADFQADFQNLPGNDFCLLSIPNDLSEVAGNAGLCESGVSAVGNEFEREMTINSIASDTIYLTVTVSWYDADNERSVEFEQVFRER